jgi:hypothetical protein
MAIDGVLRISVTSGEEVEDLSLIRTLTVLPKSFALQESAPRNFPLSLSRISCNNVMFCSAEETL